MHEKLIRSSYACCSYGVRVLAEADINKSECTNVVMAKVVDKGVKNYKHGCQR